MFESYEKRMQAEVGSVLTKMRLRLLDALADIEDSDGVIDFSAHNINAMDATMQALAHEGDAGGVMSEMRSSIEDLLDEIRNELDDAGLGRAISGASTDTMRLLLQGADEEIAANFGAAKTSIGKYLRSAMVGGVKRADLIGDIMQALETTARNAQTAADTALAATYRKVLVRSSEDAAKTLGIEVQFGYNGPGPLDANIRPFCSAVHHHRGTAADWDALLSDPHYAALRGKQPGPVSLWGGGYNCRHRLT
ncbi:MAG: hypothetical protein KAI66_20315, partial [Lentisphaeria bacterium]|nr:hypothetical protein [Lentisphaeria bacterium]